MDHILISLIVDMTQARDAVWIDGKHYKFDENGAMLTGCTKRKKYYEDEYSYSHEYSYCGANGVLYIDEWLLDNGNLYYFDLNSYMVTGRETIDDVVYYYW